MKTPEQYIPDSMQCADIWRGIVREIQTDALDSAAGIIDAYFKESASKSDGRPYTLDLQRIRASILKLKTPPQPDATTGQTQ